MAIFSFFKRQNKLTEAEQQVVVRNMIESISKRVGESNVSNNEGGVMSWQASSNLESFATTYTNHVWVYACIYAIATAASNIPIKLYERKDDKDGNEVISEVPRKLWPKFLTSPNDYTTFSDLIEATFVFLESTGRSFWEIAKVNDKGEEGNITQLFTLPSQKMRVTADKIKYIKGFTEKGSGGSRDIEFKPEEIMYIKYTNPCNDVEGLSPLQTLIDTVITDYKAKNYNKAFFDNSAVPYGTLETEQKIQPDHYDRLLAQWEKAHKGAKNAFRVSLLDGGLKYHPISMSPKDVEFINQRKLNREEILAAFKVPPILVGILEHANYSNAETQLKNFYINNIEPKLNKIENVINERLLKQINPNWFCDFDVHSVEIMKELEWKRIDSFVRLTSSGIPINSAIKYLNLHIDTLDDELGNVPLISGMPIKNLINQPAGGFGGFGGFPQQQAISTDNTEQKIEKIIGNLKNTVSKSDITNIVIELQKQQKKEQFKFAKRFSFWKSMIDEEKRLYNKFKLAYSNVLKKQKEDILEKIKNKPITKIEKSEQNINIIKAVSDYYLLDLDKYDEIYLKGITQTYKDAIKRGGTKGIAQVKVGIPFNDNTDAIDKFIKDTVNRMRNEVDSTTNKQIKSVIENAIEEGMSVGEASKNIINLFDGEISKGRATTIAHTEMMSALNYGSLQSYEQSGIGEKEWLSAFLPTSRESHVEASGQVVAIDEPFNIGGENVMFPGDPNASAENRINCFCVVLPVISGIK